MFDFDAGKLLIVGVIALIFIPPKDLPRVLRQVGQFVGKMRRMATDFQGQFMDAMREADMADLRREAEKLSASARVDVGLDQVADLKTHLTDAIDGKPVLPRDQDIDHAMHTLPGQTELADPNPELRHLVGSAAEVEPEPATPEPASQPPAPHSV